MNDSGLFLVVIGMGAITYGLRAGSLLLAERLPHSAWLISFLRFVPVAVLSAITALVVLFPNDRLNFSPITNPRLLAAAVAILVAWRTRSMLATFAVGMAALWILQAIKF